MGERRCDTVRYGTVRYDMTLGPAPCVRACLLRFVRGFARERREILLRCGVERGALAPGPAPGSAHLTQAHGERPLPARGSVQQQQQPR